MNLVDTHCHVHSEDYQLNPDEVIERAVTAGVTRLLCVGTDANDSELAVQFVQSRPSCWATIGIHPHEAKDGAAALRKLQQLLTTQSEPRSRKIVAIGECGLDYFYTHSPKEAQITALRFQIELAQQYNLPMIFHVREAFDDFWPIFDEYPGVRGVLHSFTDTEENLDKAVARGLYIGVNGIATFAKLPAQLAVYQQIPARRLLFETDAPFLTPVPLRGKVNESAYASIVCKYLAELRQESAEELATQSTQNAITLFQL